MKSLCSLALLAFLIFASKNACAGAAVAIAIGPHDKLATAYGGPIKQAKERALEEAHRRYGPNARILAATNVTGYGAVAVARHPNGVGWIIGVALGKRSATEADTLAIEQCRKAGGIKPRVRWGFWG
jgi:hypothetical protein